MGQITCCDSTANKNNLLNEPYNNPDTVNSLTSQNNNNQLNQYNNINTPNFNSNQNELGNSISSLKINESMNKNQTITSLNSSTKTPQLTSSYNQINGNTNSPFSCVKTFEAHSDKIVSLIELSNGNIATGSYDGTIKIWDINTQSCIKIIQENGNVLY